MLHCYRVGREEQNGGMRQNWLAYMNSQITRNVRYEGLEQMISLLANSEWEINDPDFFFAQINCKQNNKNKRNKQYIIKNKN